MSRLSLGTSRVSLTDMRFFHRDVEYALEDAWWVEAGMFGFTPSQPSFRSGPSDVAGRVPFDVAIDDVEPLRRQLSHGVFNDSAEAGSAHDRVVSILRGFRQDSAIPPVHVTKNREGSTCPYRLVHGAHRFYCALAAAFSHVPAIKVDDASRG